jgi:predicted nucleic acid-binding protein
MPAEFLDANVVIRYLTQDNPDQTARATKLLQQIETGERHVTTCEGVLVEIVQVLSSKRLYNFPRVDIASSLSDVVRLRGLHLPHKLTYLRALDLYASANLDFVDTLALAHMERGKIQTTVSFDHDFDRFRQVTSPRAVGAAERCFVLRRSA